MNNQDYVLAEFRRIAAQNDPKPYTVRWVEEVRNACIWMSVAGDVDWYDVRIADGVIVSAKRGPLGGPDASKYIGSKQGKKIVASIEAFWDENEELNRQLTEPAERKWNDALSAMPPDERYRARNLSVRMPGWHERSDGPSENLSFHQAVEKLLKRDLLA
jgi:hypothetical protein